MRIFVAPGTLQAGELEIRGDEHHYLTRVRRVRVGAAIDLVDGAGVMAPGEIIRIAAQATTILARAPIQDVPAPPRLRALIPVIKGDRMDTCLEKLVEVGVDDIVIWPAQRAVVRLEGDRRDGRLAKYTEQVRAAARQSRRSLVPTVAMAEDLAAALATAPRAGDRVGLVLDPSAELGVLHAVHGGLREASVISGPEGGLEPAELDHIYAAGFVGVGLGPRILRAETAPIVAVATLRAATGS